MGTPVTAIQNSVRIVKSGVGAFGILAAICIFAPAALEAALWLGVPAGEVAANLFDMARLSGF